MGTECPNKVSRTIYKFEELNKDLGQIEYFDLRKYHVLVDAFDFTKCNATLQKTYYAAY